MNAFLLWFKVDSGKLILLSSQTLFKLLFCIILRTTYSLFEIKYFLDKLLTFKLYMSINFYQRVLKIIIIILMQIL